MRQETTAGVKLKGSGLCVPCDCSRQFLRGAKMSNKSRSYGTAQLLAIAVVGICSLQPLKAQISGPELVAFEGQPAALLRVQWIPPANEEPDEEAEDEPGADANSDLTSLNAILHAGVRAHNERVDAKNAASLERARAMEAQQRRAMDAYNAAQGRSGRQVSGSAGGARSCPTNHYWSSTYNRCVCTGPSANGVCYSETSGGH